VTGAVGVMGAEAMKAALATLSVPVDVVTVPIVRRLM
jgi:hypothetical protein